MSLKSLRKPVHVPDPLPCMFSMRFLRMLLQLDVSTNVLFLSQNPNPYFLRFTTHELSPCHITLTMSKPELVFLPKTFPLPHHPVFLIKLPILPPEPRAYCLCSLLHMEFILSTLFVYLNACALFMIFFKP